MRYIINFSLLLTSHSLIQLKADAKVRKLMLLSPFAAGRVCLRRTDATDFSFSLLRFEWGDAHDGLTLCCSDRWTGLSTDGVAGIDGRWEPCNDLYVDTLGSNVGITGRETQTCPALTPYCFQIYELLARWEVVYMCLTEKLLNEFESNLLLILYLKLLV
jgi:hypothetical protein